jgi:nucleotide-binding universal stress UspA family protein
MPEFLEGRVVVPVDFSDESFAAVDVAIDIAGDPSNVTILHVMRDHEDHEHDLLSTAIDHAKRRNETEEGLRRRFDDLRHRELDLEVTFGDPGHRIAELAEIRHAKLIVMPSHGRTGLQRIYLGSVAERVVRLAHCPVLVLRNGRPATTPAKELA